MIIFAKTKQKRMAMDKNLLNIETIADYNDMPGVETLYPFG